MRRFCNNFIVHISLLLCLLAGLPAQAEQTTTFGLSNEYLCIAAGRDARLARTDNTALTLSFDDETEIQRVQLRKNKQKAKALKGKIASFKSKHLPLKVKKTRSALKLLQQNDALLQAVIATLAACKNGDLGGNVITPPTENKRSFLMGFSTFPPDFDLAAIQHAYQLSNAVSDLRSVQIDGGVPWVEMEQLLPVPQRILDDWNFRKSQSSGKKIFVSITSRGFDGIHLALYANQQGDNQALPADWVALPQNDVRVKQAYLRYAKAVIDFWQPDYLALNIEPNVVANKDLAVWQQYLELHRFVYEALKAERPSLPLFATIQVEHFKGLLPDAQGKAALQKDILGQLNPYQDIMALSVYPYTAPGIQFSDTYFDEFKSFQKPLAISETGWPSENFTIFGFPTTGSQDAQAAYLQNALRLAQKNSLVFFVNWVSVDYLKLLEKLPDGTAKEFSKTWVYNGLWDKDFTVKKALQVWQSFFQLPKQ